LLPKALIVVRSRSPQVFLQREPRPIPLGTKATAGLAHHPKCARSRFSRPWDGVVLLRSHGDECVVAGNLRCPPLGLSSLSYWPRQEVLVSHRCRTGPGKRIGEVKQGQQELPQATGFECAAARCRLCPVPKSARAALFRALSDAAQNDRNGQLTHGDDSGSGPGLKLVCWPATTTPGTRLTCGAPQRLIPARAARV
jgi:hypothetical protein